MLKRVVLSAKDGDIRAAELLLKRVWPELKGRPLLLDLPPVSTAADIVRALGAITEAAAGRSDHGRGSAGLCHRAGTAAAGN